MSAKLPEHMDDQMIEECIAKAVRRETPDILDDLLSELPETAAGAATAKTGGTRISGSESFVRSRRRIVRIISSCAAALLIAAGGISLISSGRVCATVGLDVNPGIEISVNRNNKVVSAEAVNQEGADILDDMNLKGSDVKVACNAVIGSMLTHGYLSETSNAVLLSVRSDRKDDGVDLEKKLAEDINATLAVSGIAPSIIGQYVESNKELRDFAGRNGISVGKACLIRNLMNTGSSKMTEESLLRLSTQELILLGHDRHVAAETAKGDPDTSKYIAREAAVNAALKAAGVSSSETSAVRTEFDCENGRIVYEVEFECRGTEYEYNVDAETGEVVSYEKEPCGKDSDEEDGDHDDHDDDDSDDD